MKWLIDYFARQGIFSNLVTVFVFVIGLVSLFTISREAFPNIKFDIIAVYTLYPGASAEEVEKLVTSPLEQELKSVTGIKKMSSTSIENRSSIVLQIDPDQTTEEEARRDVREAIDRVVTLPDSTEEPVIQTVDSRATPIVEVALSGGVSEVDLREQAVILEESLQDLPGVARIEKKGYRDQEIKVQVDLEKLQIFDLSLQDIIGVLNRQNLSIPGGLLESKETGREILIRTVGDFLNIEDVGNTIVRSNAVGEAIRVKDIAQVEMGFADATVNYRSNGAEAINLVIFKKDGADAINLVDIVKATVEEKREQLTTGLEISYVNDLSYYIRRRLKVLSSNMMIGLVFVLIILSLVLPGRVALITAVGIPFSFFATLIYFLNTGVSLNLLTMMGLIIVIGMLVDDAVVVTENAQRYVEKGLSPLDAAIKGTQQMWAPVTASVLTTVIAFLPMVFMSGIMGKFIKYIPFGVITALLFSLYECFFILPHHLAAWAKKKNTEKPDKRRIVKLWDEKITPLYENIIKKVLRWRYGVLIFALFLGAVTLFLASKMSFILFPTDGVEAFQVRFSAPLGTPMEKTLKIIQPIEREVKKIDESEIKNFTTQVGIQQNDPNDPNTRRGDEYGQINVYLTPTTERQRQAAEIIEDLKTRVGKIPELNQLAYNQIRGGPPVGKPVSLGVRGREYKDILEAVSSVKTYLKTLEGVSDIEDSYVVGKSELRIRVNPVEAASASLSLLDIGNTVRAAYEGVVATSIRELDEEIDIRVSLADQEKNAPETLMAMLIPNQRGHLVPLERVAHLEKTQGIAAYAHESNRRQVVVTAEVDEKITNSRKVNQYLREKIPEFEKEFPKVSYYFGGEDQDSKESMQSLGRAFLVALFGIFMILILTFKNLFQPFLVLTTIPVGAMAVIWTFYLHARPLTFLAMLGIVALAGVIVNNAIVMVSFVNQERAEGVDRFESIVHAARIRLRPIALTTITTVVGILPTAYGWGGLDPFVVPIALGLGWGIFFGSFLTTIIFPAFLAILDDIRSLFGRI